MKTLCTFTEAYPPQTTPLLHYQAPQTLETAVAAGLSTSTQFPPGAPRSGSTDRLEQQRRPQHTSLAGCSFFWGLGAQVVRSAWNEGCVFFFAPRLA